MIQVELSETLACISAGWLAWQIHYHVICLRSLLELLLSCSAINRFPLILNTPLLVIMKTHWGDPWSTVRARPKARARAGVRARVGARAKAKQHQQEQQQEQSKSKSGSKSESRSKSGSNSKSRSRREKRSRSRSKSTTPQKWE